MSRWMSVPDYQDMIETECIGCGKAISLGRSYSELVPRLCEECKEAIKFAKKLINDQEKKNMEELKPCPFCGGKAEIKSGVKIVGDAEKDIWYVVCGNPECVIYDGYTRDRYSVKQAIEIWNKRDN